MGFYEALWLEGFDDLPHDVLEAALRKTLRECKFWPVKIADVRERIDRIKETATKQAAEEAWAKVLEIRRQHWCPDASGGFYGGTPKLSPRVAQACRASGVFREVESVNDLHVWARERFIESFLAWGDAEAGKHMLPDGELRNIFTGCAQVKMLPWAKPKQDSKLPVEERLRIVDELADSARKVLGIRKPSVYQVKDSDERRAELHRQAEIIKAKYPQCSEARP